MVEVWIPDFRVYNDATSQEVSKQKAAIFVEYVPANMLIGRSEAELRSFLPSGPSREMEVLDAILARRHPNEQVMLVHTLAIDGMGGKAGYAGAGSDGVLERTEDARSPLSANDVHYITLAAILFSMPEDDVRNDPEAAFASAEQLYEDNEPTWSTLAEVLRERSGGEISLDDLFRTGATLIEEGVDPADPEEFQRQVDAMLAVSAGAGKPGSAPPACPGEKVEFLELEMAPPVDPCNLRNGGLVHQIALLAPVLDVGARLVQLRRAGELGIPDGTLRRQFDSLARCDPDRPGKREREYLFSRVVGEPPAADSPSANDQFASLFRDLATSICTFASEPAGNESRSSCFPAFAQLDLKRKALALMANLSDHSLGTYLVVPHLSADLKTTITILSDPAIQCVYGAADWVAAAEAIYLRELGGAIDIRSLAAMASDVGTIHRWLDEPETIKKVLSSGPADLLDICKNEEHQRVVVASFNYVDATPPTVTDTCTVPPAAVPAERNDAAVEPASESPAATMDDVKAKALEQAIAEDQQFRARATWN
jgi:hypothetical protein